MYRTRTVLVLVPCVPIYFYTPKYCTSTRKKPPHLLVHSSFLIPHSSTQYITQHTGCTGNNNFNNNTKVPVPVTKHTRHTGAPRWAKQFLSHLPRLRFAFLNFFSLYSTFLFRHARAACTAAASSASLPTCVDISNPKPTTDFASGKLTGKAYLRWYFPAAFAWVMPQMG